MSSAEDLSRLVYISKDERRMDILKMLSKRSEGASFKEIRNRTDTTPTNLVYHLKVMEKAGMIKKEFRNLEERRDYSFYLMTDDGIAALEMAELVYRSTEGSGGNEQPDRISVIPSRSGPRGFKIIQKGGA